MHWKLGGHAHNSTIPIHRKPTGSPQTQHTTHFLRGWSKSTSTHSTTFHTLKPAISPGSGLEGLCQTNGGEKSKVTLREGACTHQQGLRAMHTNLRLQVIKTFDLALMWAITGLFVRGNFCPQNFYIYCFLWPRPLQLDSGSR